jgi:hypothetical protein
MFVLTVVPFFDKIQPVKNRFPAESWQSGWMRRSWKPLTFNEVPGFESLTLRHFSLFAKSQDIASTQSAGHIIFRNLKGILKIQKQCAIGNAEVRTDYCSLAVLLSTNSRTIKNPFSRLLQSYPAKRAR